MERRIHSVSIAISLALMFAVMAGLQILGMQKAEALEAASVLTTQAAMKESEPNDSRETADVINSGVEITGTSNENSYSYVLDFDYFKIKAPKRGTVSIAFKSTTNNYSTSNWKVFLNVGTIDKAVAVPELTNYISGATTTRNIGVGAGDVYVLVQGNATSNAKYSLTVTYTPTDTYETEWNNTSQTATKLINGVNTTGFVGGAHVSTTEEDYFVFEAPSYGELSFDFTHPNNGMPANVWQVVYYNATASKTDLWNIDQTIPRYNRFPGNSYKTERINIGTCDQGSGHVIRIYTTADCSAYNYQIRVNFTPKAKPAIPVNPYVTVSKDSYTYNGKAHKPTVKVYGWSGSTIPYDSKNYNVKYSKNKNIGTASVTVTMKNGYSGSKTVKFSIVPKGTKLSAKPKALKGGFTAKWKAQKKLTSGYQIRYSKYSTMFAAKTKTVSGNKKTSATVKKLESGKEYYVQVCTYKKVGKKKYCSSWSASKKVKVK